MEGHARDYSTHTTRTLMKSLKLTKLALKWVNEAYNERLAQKALNRIVLHMHYRHKIWSKRLWTELS